MCEQYIAEALTCRRSVPWLGFAPNLDCRETLNMYYSYSVHEQQVGIVDSCTSKHVMQIHQVV